MPPRPLPSPTDSAPGLRSGAVARLAGMPVATLRIWEQRHQAVKPATAPSGHRLYAPADVQRLLLLRQLTGQGHAIGSIAALSSAELQRLAQQAPTPAARLRRPAPRVAVVGTALAARLQRPAVTRALLPTVPSVAAYASLQDALRAAAGAELLLWHAPTLPSALPPELAAARQACGARRVAVVYRYASSAATLALADADVATLREPADDPALGRWLAALLDSLPARDNPPPAAPPPALSAALAPRRYDDATLTRIAGLSPTLACECPRHVAELLMQLSSFEAYSAACAHRDSADARLHAYLQQVAGASRALFESALERLARHEGLPLP
ncbi:MerR family transcriptional regulator [Ideonella sp. 4Y11]|uniref:MerR family transcriptional regulator n=1 Tax=Ideonella aquatica TaxID=2824119 RepID=A0A940YCF3_9BURK|nr:MerR family transcriptional regulator [Ideonella aquatica]MBQ0957633.1 MerR family transcriptional regulator [Ideonella aquatica]